MSDEPDTPLGGAVRFHLALSADDFLRYYRGDARNVQVTTEDGRSIRFPASLLQRFVTRAGIHGRFEICWDQEHRARSLTRLE